MGNLVYVASPLTHSDPKVREKRYEIVRDYVGRKYEEGTQDMYYSPILYCHEIGKLFSLPHDAYFWKNVDTLMIDKADKFEVLMIDGWDESVGVQWEIKYWNDRVLKQEFKLISYIFNDIPSATYV